jgi:lipopolysaccharide exporter
MHHANNTLSSSMENKGKVLTGSIIMVIARLFVGLLGFISTIIVARILSPEDFGLVALAMTFVALFQLMSVLGLDSYLLSKQEVSEQDYHTVFTINLIVSIGLATLLVFGRDFVSDFYQRPEISDVILVLSLNFFINAFANIRLVKFRRQVKFHVDFIMQVIPKVVAVITTVYCAYRFQTYWALVYGMVAARGTSLVLGYIVSPYLPKLSIKNAGKVLSFSRWLMMSNVLVFINSKITDIVIGRLYSASALGVFTMARELAELPATQVIAPINRVLHSAYADANDNMALLAQKVQKSQSIIALIAIPASVGLYMTSDVLVPVMLGEQWLTVIEPLKIMALSALFYALTTNTEYIFLALNKPKLQSGLVLIGVLFFVVYIAIFTHVFGLAGLPWAVFSSMVTNYVIAMILMCKVLNLRYYSDVSPTLYLPTIATLLLAGYLHWLMPTMSLTFVSLIVIIFSGMFFYAFFLLALMRLPYFKRQNIVDIERVILSCYHTICKKKPRC